LRPLQRIKKEEKEKEKEKKVLLDRNIDRNISRLAKYNYQYVSLLTDLKT
jgi:hypothetical protein